MSVRKVVVNFVLDARQAVTGSGSSARETARVAAFAFGCAPDGAVHGGGGIDVVIGRALCNTAAVLFKVNTRLAERQTLTNASPTLRVATFARLSFIRTHMYDDKHASITSNFLIKLVISQTAILCSACYFSKPADVPSSRVIFILFHSSIHISSSHTFKYLLSAF